MLSPVFDILELCLAFVYSGCSVSKHFLCELGSGTCHKLFILYFLIL
jgi:hypothetical protein